MRRTLQREAGAVTRDCSITDSQELALSMDRLDALAEYRERFFAGNRVYMVGNSLGLMSIEARQAVEKILDQWQEHAIDGWLGAQRPWFHLAEELGARFAPLVGADGDEVVVTGSTTVNLHALAAAFYQPSSTRYAIVADELNFPSDIYALRGQIKLRGYDRQDALRLVRSADGRTLNEDDVIGAMDDDVALIVLPAVVYRSGQLLDIEKLSAAASERGIPIGFDLSHSCGVIPHDLSRWGVDFAFWCTYKYVNGGPGSVAALYVNKKHVGINPVLAGWWGSDKERQFDLALEFTPATGAGAFQIGSACILGMAAVSGSLDLIAAAGIDAIRRKSLKLTDYLIALVSEKLGNYGVSIGTPVAHSRRGGHVALEHEHAAMICRALAARGVIVDFRTPCTLRLAPSPLYTRFIDIYNTVQEIEQVLGSRVYERYSR